MCVCVSASSLLFFPVPICRLFLLSSDSALSSTAGEVFVVVVVVVFQGQTAVKIGNPLSNAIELHLLCRLSD